ncbi:MAG: hypothetical protein DRQ10_07620 [Candidatus Hydrothermota bacterium]|nr:MAG: hypothetical protein DRQ10_07620 [Candidatus Hydrothermae bacterium]
MPIPIRGTRPIAKVIRRIFKNDPALFMSKIYGMKPFQYQTEFLRDDHPYIIVASARQVGKSTMVSARALWEALANDGITVLILAPTFRQSQITFRKIRAAIERNKRIFSRLIKRLRSDYIQFINDSEIYCLPAGEEGITIRGFTADVLIIDEAAFVPDEVFASVLPSITTRHSKLYLLGTPAGKTGFFWKAWNNPQFKRYRIRASDCPIHKKEKIELAKTLMPSLKFKTEYEAEFVEEMDTFFSPSDINSAVIDIPPLTGPINNPAIRGYYIGVDVARMGKDETVYIVIEASKAESDLQPVYRIVYAKAEAKTPLTAVAENVKELIRIWKPKAVAIDETGMGGGVIDILRSYEEEEITTQIIGITFTLKTKADLYRRLRLLFEQRRIFIPSRFERLINQLKAIRYQYTQSGNLKILPDDNIGDDWADALALATYVAYETSTFKAAFLEDMADYFAKQNAMSGPLFPNMMPPP